MPKKKESIIEQLADTASADFGKDFMEEIYRDNSAKAPLYQYLTEANEKDRKREVKAIFKKYTTDEMTAYSAAMKELYDIELGMKTQHSKEENQKILADLKQKSDEDYAKQSAEKKKVETKHDRAASALCNDKKYVFSRMYYVAYEFGIRPLDEPHNYTGMTEDKIFDNMKLPEGISARDKLMTLHYMIEYNDKFGMDYTKLPREFRSKADERRFDETVSRISEFGNKYQFTETTGNGLGKGVFASVHDALTTSIQDVFTNKHKFDGKGYSNGEQRARILTPPMEESREFFRRHEREAYVKMFSDPAMSAERDVVLGRNSKTAKYTAAFRRAGLLQEFLHPAGEKDLDERQEETKLSFGRSGSPQFVSLNDTYNNFKELLDKYIKNPDEENLAKLMGAIDPLKKSAEDYLAYKDDQVKANKIKGNYEMGERLVTDNPVTNKRLKFAQYIKEKAGSLKYDLEQVKVIVPAEEKNAAIKATSAEDIKAAVDATKALREKVEHSEVPDSGQSIVDRQALKVREELLGMIDLKTDPARMRRGLAYVMLQESNAFPELAESPQAYGCKDYPEAMLKLAKEIAAHPAFRMAVMGIDGSNLAHYLDGKSLKPIMEEVQKAAQNEAQNEAQKTERSKQFSQMSVKVEDPIPEAPAILGF